MLVRNLGRTSVRASRKDLLRGTQSLGMWPVYDYSYFVIRKVPYASDEGPFVIRKLLSI
jgi:hypothetical protein